MHQIVGTFAGRAALDAAGHLFGATGYTAQTLTLLAPPETATRAAPLTQRGELTLRAAVRWGIIGALVIEVPSVIAVLLLPVDINVKVLMAAIMWKFGAGFGAWFGAVSAGERGLDQEVAEDYEARLERGGWVLAVNVRRGDRPFARGVMLESDAFDVRDVIGTFETKPAPGPQPAHRR